VVSGSDDGRWFIWEKQTGRLIKMLLGDEAGSILSPCDSVWLLPRFSSTFLIIIDLFIVCLTVVNCIQCHPFDCVVATSGIDNTIKVSLMDLICFHLLNCAWLVS
jgi:WD and tetratricopeptide repeat-containing protein 1